MKHIFYNKRGATHSSLGQFDKAISQYEKAISLKPNYAEAYYNLGHSYHKLGQLDKAVRSYKKVVDIKPEYAENHSNKILSVIYYFSKGQIPDALDVLEVLIKSSPRDALLFNMIGGCYASLGESDRAIQNYEKALALKPNYAIPKHMVNSLTGNTTKEPPKEYIKNLFNDYAERFDDSLVEKLQYKLPFIIKEFIIELSNTTSKFKKVIDLGCGTGLAGPSLIEFSDNLTGIDLSENMIKKAKKLDIYDSLIVGDIVEQLELSEEKYDLFVALDVFIYIGDLTSIFNAVRKRGNKNSCFIFSIETQTDEGYSLLKSSRYAHSDNYILDVSSDGFKFVNSQSVVLRKEGNNSIDGKVYILRAS
jgi:predicted TPR repeat methyltransferase